ncbi:hypothetical protein [Mycobacterium montefiorense]|uniref:hypothetical protein n=1 Tax=Mycobacterium montefiorense TaxID=154654 RepID=UPI0021F3064C|nr:hypothetical protein [Mycobacterium montefiorense]MCV7427945.1 hypothetical protein [Mycobacterium montefiorense]GLE50801.1 hypothetical protein ATCCBAA256_03890 [Mycobacterium montefiorense]
MYMSAERLALANQAVKDTFAHCSVAWQAFPHWDTGDPSQTMVPNDSLTTLANVPLQLEHVDFIVSLAQAVAPTPDEVLELVNAATVKLAAKVDAAVFPALYPAMTLATTVHIPWWPTTQQLLTGLIEARAKVENGGYRAPSCLVTDTFGLHYLAGSTIATGNSGTDVLLPPANINSLHRVNTLAPITALDVRGWLLGRRQRIAHGGAAGASPGEEAVDLAVSVLPSLEVVGATGNNINLRVRIRYVTRVKDRRGLVVIRVP